MNAKIYNSISYEWTNDILEGQNQQIDDAIAMLNHLIIVDTVWLKRFATHPANYIALASILALPSPNNIDQIISSDINELTSFRQYLDKTICEWAHTVARTDLDHQLCYKTIHGMITNQKFFNLIMYFFNYQTFIREKLLTLLLELDIDIGAAELIVPMPSGIEM